MSAQHTPGPWRVAKTGPRRVTSSTGIVICNAVLRNCGTAKTGIRRGAKDVLEAEANARLIAAAPELLEALEALFANYKALADSGDAGNWSLEDHPVGKQAVSAIAKALGEVA